MEGSGVTSTSGISASGCSAYKNEFGLELRVEYGPEELVTSELFRGLDADERLAEKADVLRRILLAKGFHEIAT